MAAQHLFLWVVVFFSFVGLTTATPDAGAQTSLRKVRIGVSETHVGYLPLQVAYHRGFYKDEGIDLEIVLMPTNVINTAALTEQIDINGAVTGTVGSAVQGSPMKLLIVLPSASRCCFSSAARRSRIRASSRERKSPVARQAARQPFSPSRP
jgi:ABC-type nitrate/sulfonate/bicarbonate transport system substrate-binding protein